MWILIEQLRAKLCMDVQRRLTKVELGDDVD